MPVPFLWLSYGQSSFRGLESLIFLTLYSRRSSRQKQADRSDQDSVIIMELPVCFTKQLLFEPLLAEDHSAQWRSALNTLSFQRQSKASESARSLNCCLPLVTAATQRLIEAPFSANSSAPYLLIYFLQPKVWKPSVTGHVPLQHTLDTQTFHKGANVQKAHTYKWHAYLSFNVNIKKLCGTQRQVLNWRRYIYSPFGPFGLLFYLSVKYL